MSERGYIKVINPFQTEARLQEIDLMLSFSLDPYHQALAFQYLQRFNLICTSWDDWKVMNGGDSQNRREFLESEDDPLEEDLVWLNQISYH